MIVYLNVAQQVCSMVRKFVPFAMKVRVAVAGGTGGLGRAIVNGLLSESHEVFVLSRKVIQPFSILLFTTSCYIVLDEDEVVDKHETDHDHSPLTSLIIRQVCKS